MERSRCKARGCRAEVLLVQTINEKTMPVNPIPVPDGNIVIRGALFGPPVAHVLKKDEVPGPDEPRYISHFATCPRSKNFRRR